ncbi:MAG: bifunctional DNA-formamidopyrimidine glycosylase/DNA-(apurinic or apyrimidinic site) lyase [Pseudomonadota bacterium]
MPELPEVETVMRGIAPALTGRRIERAEAYRPDLRWPLPERFAERLTGRTVLGLERRSKYILAALDDGWSWLIHLGMTGRFAVGPRDNAPAEQLGEFVHDAGRLPAHDHVLVETSDHRLIYNDVRRFGAMDLTPTAEASTHKLLATLGPEPLSDAFNPKALGAALEHRIVSVKAALLDQKIVAGLGNIYVCEALWRSKIHPTREAGTLTAAELKRLVTACKEVLTSAIEAGGSSLRDYRHADGALGYFQHSFSVYGRESEPCPRRGCSGEVERLVQGGRSSFFCAGCQS